MASHKFPSSVEEIYNFFVENKSVITHPINANYACEICRELMITSRQYSACCHFCGLVVCNNCFIPEYVICKSCETNIEETCSLCKSIMVREVEGWHMSKLNVKEALECNHLKERSDHSALINWECPSEEELVSLTKSSNHELAIIFLNLFFQQNIEQLKNFRFSLSAEQLKQLKNYLLEFKEFKELVETKPLSLKFLKEYLQKKFWFVPLSVIFECILLSETDSYKCFFWFIDTQDLTQVLETFDLLTPDQSKRLFHNSKWIKKLEIRNPSCNILEFFTEFKKGIVQFSCTLKKDFAHIFSYLLFILKTRFWNETNSFTCCIGVLLSKTDLFNKDLLEEIGKFYSSPDSSQKKRKLPLNFEVPPAPKKPQYHCIFCSKKTFVVCRQCSLSVCQCCLNGNSLCETCQGVANDQTFIGNLEHTL